MGAGASPPARRLLTTNVAEARRLVDGLQRARQDSPARVALNRRIDEPEAVCDVPGVPVTLTKDA